MTLRIKGLIFALSLFLFASCMNENEEKQKQLFNQIEIGMTQKEVTNILGKPAYIHIDSNDNKKIRYYYPSNDNTHSSAPIVYFDSSGIVTLAIYGEGG